MYYIVLIDYHYFVPEFTKDQNFTLSKDCKALSEFREAKALGISAKPVIIGPISFLLLGKAAGTDSFSTISLLERILPVYVELFSALEAEGATYIQVDEPYCVTGLSELLLALFEPTYTSLRKAAPSVKIIFATYFDRIDDVLQSFKHLPVDFVHVDLVRSPGQSTALLNMVPNVKWGVSLGLIDGRNIWKSHLVSHSETVTAFNSAIGADKVLISSSCSLLHVPYSIASEKGDASTIDAEVLEWMAAAVEKLVEIHSLALIVAGTDDSAHIVEQNEAFFAKRAASTQLTNASVQSRLSSVTEAMKSKRSTKGVIRLQKQRDLLNIPTLLPTTTIGSFPQTKEVRLKRQAFRKGEISNEEYTDYLRKETAACIEKQLQLNLDVLVHGEFERTDMVEYFGEKMNGFAFSRFGWVQSYGSRCVKPPIIYGDVSRPTPMTIDWSVYAQSLTDKPVKGMLTGPVTILQWSFVRTDQPREATAFQIALAIQDEVVDLQDAGIHVIQVDEPAIREGLPLRKVDQVGYLQWATQAFLMSTNAVKDSTQIHTHMCYSDFNEIMDTVVKMDADVTTIEASKSDLKLMGALKKVSYENDIGPGVYDIHSPRVPTKEELVQRIREMLKFIGKESLWINPDCGLKTRGWKEVEEALRIMTEVTAELRNELK